jgi:hypothetical protein
VTQRRTGLRLATAVGLAAILAHARSAWFSFTDLDDRDLIVDDQAFLARPANLLHALGRTYMHVVDPDHAYYRPLVTASYGLDAQWSGARPFGYHLTNIALHAVASVLFLALLRRFAMPPAIAALGAIVFAVHPALSAAVAWIPGRNDSLLAVFSLAAWLLGMRDWSRPSRVDRGLHLAFFALALLTKETAVVLPLVWLAQALLLGLLIDAPRARALDAVVYLSGWTALVVSTLLVHDAMLGGMGAIGFRALARNLPQVFASLAAIVLPLSPTVLADREDLSLWPGVIVAVGIAAGARYVHGVRGRVVAFGMAAFLLLLVPVLAVPGTVVLDNRLYLPACGALLAIAEIARASVFERADPREAVGRRLFFGLGAVLVLVLVAVTAAYEESFRDRRAFARAAVAGAPHSALAHFCLGKAYQTDGDEDRAIAEYETSLALGSGEVVHNNIAVIHMAHARWADAERELHEELAIDPRYARAYDNLSIVLRREGREDESRTAAETARHLEAE